MIRNTLVEGLNRRVRLPNAIIVLCSENFIMDDPLFLPSEFERKLKWILREFMTLIEIRKSILPQKAYILGEPRIMWVQAFNNTRRNKLQPDQLQKFNNLLRRLCGMKAIYTIPIKDSSSRCFDFDGKTQIEEGFNYLWHQIIQGLKYHDEKDKQHQVNALVDDRLSEINLQSALRADGNHHTFQAVKSQCKTFPAERRVEPQQPERTRDKTDYHSHQRSSSDGRRYTYHSHDRHDKHPSSNRYQRHRENDNQRDHRGRVSDNRQSRHR